MTAAERREAHRAEMVKRKRRRAIRDNKGAVAHAYRTATNPDMQAMWLGVWNRLCVQEIEAR